MRNQKRISLTLRWILALALIEGLLVLWSFVREPSEANSAVILGFSYLRLVLILLVLFLLLSISILLLGSFRNSWQPRADEYFIRKIVDGKGVLWGIILWVTLSYLLLFSSEQQLGFLASYRERLFPIILWLAGAAIQLGLGVLYLRGMNPGVIRNHQGRLRPALAIFFLFVILLLLITFTRLGLTPDQVYWQEPGVPILLFQVFVSTFAGVLLYLYIEGTNTQSSSRLDLFIFLGVWGLACLIWLNQPAKFTWFSLQPTPPNYQSYPFSDALVYDHAGREYLIGKPIPSDFWAKPLYSFFLGVLHLFSGGNYALLESLQVIVLALIPAFAYLLMVRLGSRPAGIIIASLLIFREWNALALSNVIQVSHVKLLLSDVFAMGFMVLLLWLYFHWAERTGERRRVPLILGGMLSLLSLTRGHPVLLLPFLLFGVFVAPAPRFRLRWEAVALTILGFLLPLIPWFWRNYESTGTFAFQYPISPYSALMSTSYSFEPTDFDPQNLPLQYSSESDFAYYNRLQKQAAEFAMDHPDQVAKFISAHYFHNLIFSYIYLPLSFQIEGAREYVKTQPFWNSWQGELSFQGSILLLIQIGLIALGFGYLWKKHKYLAAVPLFLGMGYNLSVSIGRLSGWRFILPADWITLIYYAAGLLQFYELLRSSLGQEVHVIEEHNTLNTVYPLRLFPLIGYALFFLTIGLALTKGQELFARRYPEKSISELREDYIGATGMTPVSGFQLDEFLQTDGSVIAYGQALNPSFLAADEEGFDTSWSVYYFWPSYRPKPFSRVIFNLSGPRSAGVILPMETPPPSFPDGADVIVIGCWAESGEVTALAVLIKGASPIHYTSEAFSTPACPLSISE